MTVIFLHHLSTESIQSPFILEDIDRTLVIAHKMAELVEQACILEYAPLHHLSRNRIADEMASPKYTYGKTLWYTACYDACHNCHQQENRGDEKEDNGYKDYEFIYLLLLGLHGMTNAIQG